MPNMVTPGTSAQPLSRTPLLAALQMWRSMPPEAFGPGHASTLTMALAGIRVRDLHLRAAASGDCTAAIGIALLIVAGRSWGLQSAEADVAMSSLASCAGLGDATARLVLEYARRHLDRNTGGPPL